MSFTPEQIRERIAALGPWYQNITLDGIETIPGGPPPRGEYHDRLLDAIPADLTGKTVLDIGCNAGYFSLVCKQRGAEYVLGIDKRQMYIQQAEFCKEVFGLRIDFNALALWAVPHYVSTLPLHYAKQFDLVLCIGVLYHMRDLITAVVSISTLCTGTLIVETATAPRRFDDEVPLVVLAKGEDRAGHSYVNRRGIVTLFEYYGRFQAAQELYWEGRGCYKFHKHKQEE